MKKIFMTLILCLFSVTTFAGGLYVGSAKSNKYHYPTCKFAKRINLNNLIYFENPESARKAGYKPCAICKPPLITEKEE